MTTNNKPSSNVPVFQINAKTIRDDRFVMGTTKEDVNFTDQTGKPQTHYRYPLHCYYGEPIGATKDDPFRGCRRGPVFYQGGEAIAPTEEDPYRNCLKGTLVRNQYRKEFPKKDEKGEIVMKEDGKTPVMEKSGAPYNVFISPREGGDPAFDALVKAMSTLRLGALKAFVKSPVHEDQGYDQYFRTAEQCMPNVMKNIVDHPLVPKSTKRDKTRPMTAVFDVYDSGDLAVPIGVDNYGVPISKNFPKEKLLDAKDKDGKNIIYDLFFLPLLKFHKIHIGSGRVSIKSYFKSAVLLSWKKRVQVSMQLEQMRHHAGRANKSLTNALAKFDQQMEKEKGKKSDDKPVEKKSGTNEAKSQGKPLKNETNTNTDTKPPPSTTGSMVSTNLPRGTPMANPDLIKGLQGSEYD